MIQRKMSLETAIEVLHSCQTPEEIYELLVQDKVRGKVASFTECPAARWIEQHTGQSVRVTNNRLYASATDVGGVSHTPAFDQFIHNFDQRLYFSLIAYHPAIRPFAYIHHLCRRFHRWYCRPQD